MDGHGFEISKRAKEVRDRKKNRNTLFDKENKKTLGKDHRKLNITKQSSNELKKIATKNKYLSESENIRILLLSGIVVVILLVLLWRVFS